MLQSNFLLLIIFIFFTGTSLASSAGVNLKAVEVAIKKPTINFEIASSEDKSDPLFYIPNSASSTKLSLDLNLFSVSLELPGTADTQELDATNSFDFQLFGVTNTFIWEAYYQNYQGLYAQDNNSIVEKTATKQANAYSYGAKLLRFTNKNFNPRYSLGHFEKKRQRAWSWVQGINLDRYTLSSSSDLIPDDQKIEFKDRKDVNSIDSTTLGLEFGYAGSLTAGSFYLNGHFNIGLNAQNQVLGGTGEENNIISTNANIFIDTGLVFAKNHFAGASIKLGNQSSASKNFVVQKTRSDGGIYYRYFF